MLIEGTASTEAPAPVVTTVTPPPATPVTAQTPAPAAPVVTSTEPVNLKGQSKEAHKAVIIAALTGKAKEAPAVTAAPVVETAESADDAAKAAPVAALAETTGEDAEAARLNELAQQARAVARREKSFRDEQKRIKAENEAREASWKAREASSQAERDRIARIEAARGKNSPLEVLRAAGFTKEQLDGTIAVDLLNEMEAEQKGQPVGVPLTEEKARAMFAEQQRIDREKAETERQAQAAADLEREKNSYFSAVEREFKTDAFPRVAAVGPSMGELDAHFNTHFRATGVGLSPAQLLAAFEKRYEEAGITVAPKPKLGQKPAPVAPRAATKTITSAATSDSGAVVLETVKPRRSIAQIHAEGRAAAIKSIEAKHAAAGR